MMSGETKKARGKTKRKTETESKGNQERELNSER